MVRELCETRYGCAFGNDNFLALAKTCFDVLCHHGAEVGDYRSPDFDPYRAAAANLFRLPEVLRALKDRGCGRLVVTGSVFEASYREQDGKLLPCISGQAHVTAEARLLIDDADPLAWGIGS